MFVIFAWSKYLAMVPGLPLDPCCITPWDQKGTRWTWGLGAQGQQYIREGGMGRGSTTVVVEGISFYVPETHVMYFIRRGWFLKCSEEGLLVGGGVLLVHSEIYYVPIGDGWEEVLVHNVLHYVPVRAISGPKKVSIFRAHPFQCPL